MSIGVAFDGTNFLVGIQGDATAHYNITAQLVSQSGTLVGSRISIGRTGGAPFVAFDGTNYLLVWPDDATHLNDVLYGQFISTTGTLVGSAFQIGPLGAYGDMGGLAYGGGNYLAVYFKEVNTATSDSRVFGRIISPSGTVGSEITISTGFGDQGLQNVAFDGNNFLVVWTDDGNDYEVKGRFVSPSGTLGTEFTINASSYPSDNPLTVAFGGTNYLVVWMDEVGGLGSGEWDLFGQRVDTSGGLIGGPIPISSAPSGQYFPLLAFDGTNFLVTWTDMRNDTNHDGICDNNEGTCWDIYGRFISPAGTAVGPEFPITTDPGNQFLSPVVFGGGKYLVVWTSGDTIDGTLGDVFGAFVRFPDKIGIFRSGVWFLDSNGNGTWDGCGTDKCIPWGDPTDKIVVGDWNGDGRDKIGVYRNGTWYLDYNGNGAWDGCGTDQCISWGGDPADEPVLGDWNGDGKTKVGIYRTGVWYLDVNGNGVFEGCSVDQCIAWGGDPADKPVIGDWNGDGKTKVGIVRSGTWYLDYNGDGLFNGCGTDKCIAWGSPGDTFVVGRW